MTLNRAGASSAEAWGAIASAEPRLVVTGASGWLGRTMVDLAAMHGITVLALASSTRDGLKALSDLSGSPAGDGPLLLLHFAFLTQDKVGEVGTERYVAENCRITDRVLTWVRDEKPDGVFLASSGAAARDLPLGEDPYGALKRLDEYAFAGAATEVGARLRTARIFNLVGANITKPGHYALGDLIAAAAAGRPLSIRSRGEVIRSFVGVQDLLLLAMAELLSPCRPGQLRFDTYGYELEIAELAQSVAAAVGREDLPIVRPETGNGDPDVYLGDPHEMPALLALHGIEPTSMRNLIVQTAASMA